MANDGHLYVIRNGDYCKIGFTGDPGSRIKVLVTKYDLFYPEVFVSEYNGIARVYESVIHYKFIESIIGDEWFKVDFNKAVTEVKRLIESGFSGDDVTEVKKPRISITPKTLTLLNELCDLFPTPIKGVSNKIQIVADLIIKAHKKEIK